MDFVRKEERKTMTQSRAFRVGSELAVFSWVPNITYSCPKSTWVSCGELDAIVVISSSWCNDDFVSGTTRLKVGDVVVRLARGPPCFLESTTLHALEVDGLG